MIACVEVGLIIPDNEARTALATLQRLGVALGGLERADLYLCEISGDATDELVATLRGIETVFNPNKHAIRVRPVNAEPGEVWVDEADAIREPVAQPIRIAGREIAGLRTFERFVAWRLWAAPGVAADTAPVGGATDLLLCNPAFQIAALA